MFRTYLKTAFRQFQKNKLITAINIGGLALGFSTIMLLSGMVYSFLTANHMFQDRKEMYYLKTVNKDGSDGSLQTTYPLLYEVLKSCPQVQAGTHYQQWYSPWLKVKGHEIQEEAYFADTGFFKVFPFAFKYGNPDNALKQKFNIVLSEETAEKLFGNTNPVGQTVAADDTLLLTVTGVLKHVPANNNIKPPVLLTSDLLRNYPGFDNSANWYNGFAENYLRLKPRTNIESLEKSINEIIKAFYVKERKDERVRLKAFDKLFSDNSDNIGKSIISGSVGTSLFILLILIVNLINLNAGSMYKRVKEIAVKKIIGSSKWQAICQFLTENTLIIFGAFMLGALFFYFFLVPSINKMFGDRFGKMEVSEKEFPVFLILSAIALAVVCLSVIPAFYVLKLRTSDAIKGKLISRSGGTSTWRNIFITVQFFLSVIIVYSSIILTRQINFMKTASTGFSKDVAVVNLDLAFRSQKSANSRFDALLNDLRNNADVVSFSTNSVIPTSYPNDGNGFVTEKDPAPVYLKWARADAGYFPTYSIKIVEGRNFDNNVNDSIEGKNVIINEAARNALGWVSAVGKRIKELGDDSWQTVIGVCKDFNYATMAGKIEPTLHFYAGKQRLKDMQYLSLAIAKDKSQKVLGKIKEEFKSMPSRREFSYSSIGEKVGEQYKMLDGILKMTRYAALITIFIAMMGMLGLISILLQLRVKEIGVRKVLGASTVNIAAMFSRNFLMMVAVASFLAAPIAGYIMNKWLQNFAYRIRIEWWMFLAGAMVVLLIALITVGSQTLKAAIANPVKSLRTE